MSNILKGLQLNEVDPRNFDSDWDYYDALKRKKRSRSEDDYVEPQDDEPNRFEPKQESKPEYSINKQEDRDAGYNMTLTVKAPTTQKAQWAAEKYIDHNWGAKKQVGKITPVSDGVVKVHMIDNHKHGMWKPWKDEDPVAKPISFNEGRTTTVSVLTEARIYKLWENAGQKIVEAQLTADQINQIFQYAEKIQTAGGDNRTMLGKGKDVAGAAAGKAMDAAGAVNKAWEDLKTKVQDSGPIKNVDAMYDKAAEQLKQATGGDQGVMKYVQKYRDFAKKHPIAQSLIYSALIAAAGISGAGLGGAAALGLFKMVDKLLQGEKFSSAAYSGAKTGAMAYGASKVGDMVKGAMQHAKYGGEEILPVTGAGKPGFDSEWDNYLTANPNSTMSPDQIRAAADSVAPVAKQAGNAATSAASEFAGNASGITIDQIMATPEFKETLAREMARAGNNPYMIQAAKQAAMSAGKVAAAKAAGVSESVDLTESQIYLMIGKIVERQHKLDEGIMDTIKGAAGKAVDWAKTKGTNLTTKVTADKLLQAWKKAGSPTDSLDVAKIVQNAGVPSDTIKQVFNNMKIPFAGQTGGGNDMTRKIDVDPSSVAPNASTSITPASVTGATSTGAPGATATGGTPTTTGSTANPSSSTYEEVKKLIDQLDKEGKQTVTTTLKKDLQLAEGGLNELSNQKLGQYKKAAGADATKADKAGDTKKADKRFSGIVKATKKQFANDEKVDEAYNNYHANRTGFSRPSNHRDDERHDLDTPSQVWGLKINGKVWSKGGVDVTFKSKEAALNIRNSILKNRPDLEIGLVTKGGSPASGAQSKTDDNFRAYLAQRKAGQQEQLDEIIDPSTAKAQFLRWLGRKFATAFPWLATGAAGAGLAYAGLLAPIVASLGGAANAIAALGTEAMVGGAVAGTYAAPSLIQSIKDLFAADENSIQAGIKRWVEKYVGDEQDVQEFMSVHSKAAYEGKPGFRWRAREWPVKMTKEQAEAYLEKNEKSWLDYEKQKAADAEKAKAEKDKEVTENQQRGVDSRGRTQQQWAQLVKSKFPGAKITQAKMIDGPMQATLPDGRKLSWSKVEQNVTESVDYKADAEELKRQGNMVGYHKTMVRYYDALADNAEHRGDAKRYEALANKHHAASKNMTEDKCPECGGPAFSEESIAEAKDACYSKVKSRYKVWPSAYASGALVKCRKVGASNWGNKSKK